MEKTKNFEQEIRDENETKNNVYAQLGNIIRAEEKANETLIVEAHGLDNALYEFDKACKEPGDMREEIEEVSTMLEAVLSASIQSEGILSMVCKAVEIIRNN